MQAKRAFQATVILIAVATSVVLSVILPMMAYDPLGLLASPWRPNKNVYSNLRLALPGILKRKDFDAVLLGTSVMENMSAQQASWRLGHQFANLSLTASDFVERGIVLDHLLRRGRVAMVVMSVDSVYNNQRNGYPLYPLATWDYLYDQNPFNDLRAMLNAHFLSCTWRWSVESTCIGSTDSLDHPNAWIGDPEQARRFGGIENWCAARDNHQVRDGLKALNAALARRADREMRWPDAQQQAANATAAVRYVDHHLLRHVRNYPRVKFKLFFPPYHRALYAIWHQTQPNYREAHEAVLRQLVDAARNLPNLEVYAFENQAFVDDLANYKDFVHYGPVQDTLILDALASGTARLTSEDIVAYLAEARARAMAFDLAKLKTELERCGVQQP